MTYYTKIPAAPFRNMERDSRFLFNKVQNIPGSAARDVADLFRALADELDKIAADYEHKQALRATVKKSLLSLEEIPANIIKHLTAFFSPHHAKLLHLLS